MRRLLVICVILSTLNSCAAERPTAPRLERLAGRMFDADSVPAHGALVRAFYRAEPSTSARLAWADANGQFEFGDVLAGGWVVLANHGVAWAAAETLYTPSTSSGLRLASAGAIRGRARLLGAASHANIMVRAQFPEAVGESDSTGSYTCCGIAPGSWQVVFSHAGYRDTSASFTIAAAGDTTTLPDMILVPAN